MTTNQIPNDVPEMMKPLYDRMQRVGSQADCDHLQYVRSPEYEASKLKSDVDAVTDSVVNDGDIVSPGKTTQGIMIQPGEGFGLEAVRIFNPLGYAVAPAYEQKGKFIPAVKFGGLWLQNDIASLDNEKFLNSPAGYIILCSDSQAMAWLDCDTHGQPADQVRAIVKQAFGLTDAQFDQAMFQHNPERNSIHLVFRVPHDLRARVIADRNAQTNFYCTEMKSKHNARIPPKIEFKMSRDYCQCRMKPGKFLYPKVREDFPLMTHTMIEIVEGIRNSRQTAVQARPAAKPFMPPTDPNDDKQARREQIGRNAVTGILGDIESVGKGCHNQTVFEKSLRCGKYYQSWNVSKDWLIGELTRAAISSASPEDKSKAPKTVRDGFKIGEGYATEQPLKNRS